MDRKTTALAGSKCVRLLETRDSTLATDVDSYFVARDRGERAKSLQLTQLDYSPNSVDSRKSSTEETPQVCDGRTLQERSMVNDFGFAADVRTEVLGTSLLACKF